MQYVQRREELAAAPRVIKHVTVYSQAGRYGGWPANHGVWSWGNEILVGFSAGSRAAGAKTVLDEEASQSEQFKRVLASWRQFRTEQHRWFSIADTRAELAVYRTER